MIARLSLLDCSLEERERAERAERWRAVTAQAVDQTEHGLAFPPDPGLAAELAELATLETECCGASFALAIERGRVTLALGTKAAEVGARPRQRSKHA